MNYSTIQRDALAFASEAVAILRRMQSSAKIVNQKDEVDIATTADLAAEKIIIDNIRKKYPGHKIYSEEMGGSEIGEWVWYVDPLDGTKEYVRGLGDYGCLIAVERNGGLVACAIHECGSGDIYSASKGGGAYFNSKKLRVSGTNELSKSIVGYHLPGRSAGNDKIDRQLKILSSLIPSVYIVRPGSWDAKNMSFVARGGYDAHLIPAGLKNLWHDLAPGILMVTESGGTITDWNGKPIKNHDISNGIIASNGKIHTDLVKIVKTI